MKIPTSLVAACFLAAWPSLAPAQSTEDQSLAIEGAYLWVEDDSDRRAIDFDRGGSLTMISDLQGEFGHTTGIGSWRLVDDGKVKARIVDFDFDPESNTRRGTGVTTYELEFSDLQDGRYQAIAGSAKGAAIAFEDNPLSPNGPPAREWDFTMEGRRISAE
jgi:hypothetical protein